MTVKRAAIAKISTPRLFGVVPRARLFARLDENRGRSLIWIEGPPGAGKTTLVASYLEARGIPTLWYQIDPGDVDAACLFHYLAIAAATLLDTEAVALPRLVPEHLPDLPAFTRTFFRELFACLPAGVVVVLDNYQEAPEAARLHEMVRAAAGAVPPDSSIVGISRSEAPAPFSHLAAQGALFALRPPSLQLTLEETRAMSAARDVHADWLVRALHQQSEGWAAGITLMLERLGHTDRDLGLLPSETRQSVFDYFATLLFDHAGEETRWTLLDVAFLPHLTASMAETLSGRGAAGQLLDDLYRRHLFTDRRPGIEPVYQFHALFRDFLQRRAGEMLGRAETERLMTRSAQLLETNGDAEAAMDLYVATQHWKEITELILRVANGLLRSGRWDTLERWIQGLPPEVGQHHPRLLYWLGMAQLQSDPARGLATLRLARDAFAWITDREGRTLVLAALVHASHMGLDGVATVDEWLGELIDAAQTPLNLSPEVELSVWSSIAVGVLYLRPWHPLAQPARQRVQGLLERESDPTVALMATATTLYADTESGNLEMGDALASRIEVLANRQEASPSARAWFLFSVAHLRFHQARYEESLAYFDAAREAASASGLRETLSDIRLNRVMVEYRLCGWAQASSTLREFELHPGPMRPFSLGLLRTYQARRAHFQGQWEEAGALAMSSLEAIGRVGSPHMIMQYGLYNGEILVGAGRLADARAVLATSRSLLERSPVLDCYWAGLALCEAFLAHVAGDRALALSTLRQALVLAKEGARRYYVRFFECCMPPMFSLALEEGIEVVLVRQLIRMFRLKPPPQAPDSWPRPVRIWTLGRFAVCVDEQPLAHSRKVPRKTLALLKALVAHGGESVPEQWLCDSLWGDEEADAAHNVLNVTVARLRKLLGAEDAVVQQGGRIWLDRQRCWVDAWRFQALLAEGFDVSRVRAALQLYAGTFLPEDEGEAWAVPMRERLRGKFIHALATCGQALEAQRLLDEATQLYLRGIEADVVVESFHCGLMRCYRSAGRLTEAVSAYRRLRQTVSAVLGVAPSAASEALYRQILQELATESAHASPQSVAPVGLASIQLSVSSVAAELREHGPDARERPPRGR